MAIHMSSSSSLSTTAVAPPVPAPEPPPLSSVQPPSEHNRQNKLCVMCETRAATKFCARCGCTSYCCREHQQHHWAHGHKKQCCKDPLREAVARAHACGGAEPTYRPYTDEERVPGLF